MTCFRRWVLARRSFCLVKFLRADAPGVRLGIATGLALAATFLTKISNLPLLAVSGAVVLFKMWNLSKVGKLRAAFPALASLALCAGLPIACWLAWTKYNFGDFTGTAAKIQFLNWTHKPFGEWWQHPIFTPHGLWTFVSGLMATFWQGEFLWHRQPLASPVVDAIYAISSVGFVGVAVVALLSRSTDRDRTATAGAVVRLRECSLRRWRFWGSCPSFTIFTTAFIRRAPIRISRPAG